MNTPLNILIVDDEPFAHRLLESYCEKLSYAHIVGNCYDGLEALNYIHQETIDVLLLDIHMPEITGMELLETLQEKAIKVIMVTAYSDHAIETYNYEFVVDYLLKPIKFVRFVKALERAKKNVELERHERTEQELKITNPQQNHLSIKDGKQMHRITYESLCFVQAYGNYLKLFLVNGDMKLIRGTLSKLDKQLSSFDFCRIHKSYLVNLKHVDKIDANLVHIQNTLLPLGSSFSHYVKERFMQ